MYLEKRKVVLESENDNNFEKQLNAIRLSIL
jgi:hypothetical protein